MGRTSGLRYTKRDGYYSTINRHKYYFGRDKKIAERDFISKLHEHHKGELLSNDAVVKLIDEYLNYKQKTNSELSYKWYKRPLDQFKRYVGPKKKIGSLAKADLELFIIDEWSTRLDGKPLSPSTIQQAKRSIKSCFTWLVDNRKISFNPFRTIVVGKHHPAKNIPTKEQIAAVLKHFEHDEDFTDLISFVSFTGARVYEARTILCSQVKLAERTIVLSAEQTKSYESLKDKRLRTILLNKDALEVVKRNLEKNKTGFLFQNPNSVNSKNQWEPNAVKMRLRRAKKHLGFYFTQRSIRHYWATEFLKAGGGIAEGAALLGHSNPTMLLTNYQKIYDDNEHLLKHLDKVNDQTIVVKKPAKQQRRKTK